MIDAETGCQGCGELPFPRRRRITIRKTIDLVIGTFCIERGRTLLYNGRDFAPMKSLLG